MLRLIYLYLLVLAALTLVSCQKHKNKQIESGSFAELKDNFANPPPEFSTSPLWVWNDQVTREKIDAQLEEFKKENILQVFVHPRPGLITEYLSDEWNELYTYTVGKGKELGMNVWIYDENSFPSGFAGGHVQAEMPESYKQGNTMVMRTGDEIKPGPTEYLVILEKEGAIYKVLENLPTEISDNHYAFEVVHEKSSGWYGGFAYVDLLIPGVTEKFIELTMSGYEEAIGEDFGAAVPGVFTDEPNIAPRGSREGVRYTPSLFSEFESKWGYDLRPHLIALFQETIDYKRTRYHFYRLLLELFIERWSKPWYQYTENKNLKWTGHYWEHGWPSPYHGGDNMAMYAWHQVPGIDMLFNTFDLRPDQFGNVRAVKELGSVANQLGRERALSETYGGAGWELTFQDLKRLGDWEYTLGVNFMNQHLSYMTLKGRRKGDFPQSFLTHAPYWDDYGVLAQYFSRLSFALSRGEQVNNILIIEPTTTAWMYYSPTQNQSMLDSIESGFRTLVDDMEKFQLEYDLGAENIIKDHGSVDGDRFIVGERSYSTVILPPFLENIDDGTWQLLQQYLKNGGKVFSFSVPVMIDGEANQALTNLAGGIENWQAIKSIDQPEVLNALLEDDFNMENTSEINGKVYHMRRHFTDGQLIFWSNFNQEGQEYIKFKAAGQSVSALDPLTGEIQAFPAETRDGMVSLEFDLPAAGSKLLFVHSDKVNQSTGFAETYTVNWQKTNSTATDIMATAPNSLTIDYLDLKVNGQTFEDLYFSMAADSAYKLNGLEPYGRSGYNPWAVAVQYKKNILDMGNRFEENSGFTATYSFEIAAGFQPTNLEAVIEWAHLYDVSLNGTSIKPIPDRTWLDHSFNVFDLTNLAKPGVNQLTLSITPMHIHAEIEPVYLRGDFSLSAIDQGFRLIPSEAMKIGSWKNQGRPFYSQSVSYQKPVEVNNDKRYLLKLNDWNGTVTRVLVDDKQVGIIGWPPYEIDLTPYLEPGNHRVGVEVVGSLKNLLGPHHGNIRRGIVTPWSWFNGPTHQPSGTEYHLLDYGLFEDFEILTADKKDQLAKK